MTAPRFDESRELSHDEEAELVWKREWNDEHMASLDVESSAPAIGLTGVASPSFAIGDGANLDELERLLDWAVERAARFPGAHASLVYGRAKVLSGVRDLRREGVR